MSPTFFSKLEKLLSDSAVDTSRNRPSQVLQDAGVPSATIAILDNGEISAHCISSIGDDTETLFQACSISKPTAGVAVMRLVELGYFGVHDRIRGLLPQEVVEILSQDPRTEALFDIVTVAHLMSHTAGLSVSGFPGYPYGTDVPDVVTLLKGKEASNTMKIGFCSIPGTEFIYSGGGTTILQCIMENVTKMAFPDIVKKYVFEPLGMTRSLYKLPDEEANISRCFYQGYRKTEAKWHFQPELAAAGVWTTPTDLMKLARGMQDSLRGNGPLQKDTAKTMLTRITNDIALGWFITSTGFCHSGGNNPGWKCLTAGYADLDWNTKEDEARPKALSNCGIAVMTNSQSGFPVVFKLFLAMAYLKGWPTPPIMISGEVITPFRAPLAQIIDRDWKEWVGDWGDKWKLANDAEDGPVAGIRGQPMLKLKPAAIPPEPYEQDRSSIDLVLDGTEIMLRLGWQKDKRIVKIWNGALMSSKTLERS